MQPGDVMNGCDARAIELFWQSDDWRVEQGGVALARIMTEVLSLADSTAGYTAFDVKPRDLLS